jgi:HEAT repeat protein
MENTKLMLSNLLGLTLALSFTLGGASIAQAGRGGSAEAIQRAITSGSVDALSAELERSERLMCSNCVPMVRALVDHQDARVRRVAAWWLARRGLRSELFVEMALRLGQPDSQKARNAADVLGGMRSLKAVEPLGAALNNPLFDAEARVAMAAALGRIGEPGGQAPLLQATAAADPRIRAAALSAMRDLRAPIDTARVAPLLEDADLGVRAEAIYTLGGTRGHQLSIATRTTLATALLRRLTLDPEASVRAKAAWALGEIVAPAAVAEKPLQVSALQDRDSSVRSLATAALSKLQR